jgi:ATP-dependent DNA helicase RecG
LRVAMLHGQMKAKEKDAIMKSFREREIDLLVSTSVIEVGVDVPNATIMMIEGADRFGLAQLYQFRGRVGRGEHQSYCFLFTDSSSAGTRERLNAIVEAKNGFELAERDLALLGPGEFLGQKQTGLPDIAMNSLQNIELIKNSRAAAVKIIQGDPGLNRYPFLKQKLDEFKQKIHLE